MKLLLVFFIQFITLSLFSKNEIIDILSKNVIISGILTYDSIIENKSIVIIVPGSGATDMNGNSSGAINNSYLLLSESLVKSNLAVFRYDKRGVGKSTNNLLEDNILFNDYVEDLITIVQNLNKKYKGNKIYIAGHSEGSLHAILAAQKIKVDGIISINGPSVSIDSILKIQLMKQPNFIKELAFPIIDSLKKGKRVENVNSILLTLFRPSVQQYIIDWMKYSPKDEIKKLTCRKLIFQSANDMQIDSTNAYSLHNSSNSSIFISTHSNHIFKDVDNMSENMDSYNNPKYPIDRLLVQEIQRFISKDK